MSEPSAESPPEPKPKPGTIERALGTGDDPFRVRVTPLTPMGRFREVAVLLKIAGPILAPIVTTGGVIIDGEKIPLGAMLFHEASRRKVLGDLITRLPELDPDEVHELAVRLIVDRTEIRMPGVPAWVPIKAPPGAPLEAKAALIDALVPDVWTLIGIVKTALEANFSPTSAVASITGDSSTAETPAKPADT